MALLNFFWILLTLVSLQGIFIAQATFHRRGGGRIGHGCGADCGGYVGYGGGISSGCGGYGGYGGGISPGCGPAIAPSPPISFVPVPQSIPVQMPEPPKPSVTIPNIILALLPPNNSNKPSAPPTPIGCPAPVIIPPTPQPCPCPTSVPNPCGC